MNHETYLQIDWEYAKENKIRVLRVYGSEPILTLPERIGDCPLTEIGAYCFAKSPHLPEQYHTDRGTPSGKHPPGGCKRRNG